MRQKLLDLHEIQKIDLEIREVERKREDLQSRVANMGGSVDTIRTQVTELTDQRETITRETKTLEGMVQAESLKIRKWETRLNEIRNQREYLALSREVEGSKRANRDAEDKILELMTQREAIDKQLDVLQDQLAEEEVDFASERASVEQQLKDLEDGITASSDRRNGLLGNIPKNLLKRYDAIRNKRLGIGLVAVVDGCCQGCNMALPPQLYNILQRGETIEQCPSCQRIIFWDKILEPRGSIEASP